MSAQKKPTKTPATPAAYISNPLDMVAPSWRALRLNLNSLIALIALVLVPIIVGVAVVLIGIANEASANTQLDTVLGVVGIAALIATVVAMLLGFATSTVIMLASARGEKLGLRAAYAKARPFVWRLFLTSLLTALAVLGGLILLVIPGLIFAAWFGLSLYVVVAEDLKPVAAMRRSKELVRGRVWEMFGLQGLANAASLIPLIGPIVSAILGFVMMPAMAIRYVQLSTIEEADRGPIHWANYAIAIIGALASGFNAGAGWRDAQQSVQPGNVY